MSLDYASMCLAVTTMRLDNALMCLETTAKRIEKSTKCVVASMNCSGATAIYQAGTIKDREHGLIRYDAPMRNLRKLRFITRRRLSWVAVIAASLCAVLFVSTVWFSPTFVTLKRDYQFWLIADRGRVDAGINSGGPYPPRMWYTITPIEKHSPIEFDLWFRFDRGPISYLGGTSTPGKASPNPRNTSPRARNAPPMHTRLIIPLWFPFAVCAAAAVYLWRSERPEPWQCASCRYDLRGIDSDICPECGKQSVGAS